MESISILASDVVSFESWRGGFFQYSRHVYTITRARASRSSLKGFLYAVLRIIYNNVIYLDLYIYFKCVYMYVILVELQRK